MATKEAYQRQYLAQLRAWDADVKEWKAKTANAKPAVRPAYEDEIKNLGAHRASAQKRLNDLVNQEDDTWEPLQQLAEEAWAELRKATARAGAIFGATPPSGKS